MTLFLLLTHVLSAEEMLLKLALVLDSSNTGFISEMSQAMSLCSNELL